MSQYNDPYAGTYRGTGGSNVEVNTAVIRPFDRVRWPSIFAGLFVAISVFLLLQLLGAAIGLTIYNVGEAATGLGTGAAIWSAIALILAFFAGGWLAARSAVLRGSYSGLLNGALVWAVGIPLMILVLAGAMGGTMRTAAQVAGQTGLVQQPIRATIGTDTREPVMTQQEVQRTVEVGRGAAWGSFITLLLGLGAAAFGGYAGSQYPTRDEYTTGGRSESTTTIPRTTPPPQP